MNLIDRDKLIEELKHFFWTAYQPLSAHPCEWSSVIAIINKQENANEWISVERELPIIKGVGENYLVTLDDGSVDLAITDYVKGHSEPSLGYYGGEELDVFTEYKGIIAWKPIEPYEVNNEH